jgi:CelD/BcsL family acetyltransferase involved in cellulose biosynthesis
MRIHQDWSTAGFELEPVAAQTGPFPRRSFLHTWWRHFSAGAELMLAESPSGLLPLLRADDMVAFVGDEDVTDYHSPLGDAAALGDLVGQLPSGTKLVLDSLPATAAESVTTALATVGINPTLHQHEVAAVLALPDTYEDWLTGLSKKTRHEVRRKGRRFEALLGPSRLERVDGPAAVATFASMHRRAFGDKGGFMTPEMEAFFADLHAHAGAVIDVLYGAEPQPSAAAFGFEDDTTYYLYNSAYDPDMRDASPGIVLLSSLIARAIADHQTTIDFLKGDEPYKFQHGAHPRPLYAIDINLGDKP